jgi:hypothetical protein
MKCDLCKTEPTIPVKLECGHYFCFLCLEPYMYDDDQKCPECGEVESVPIENDYMSNKNYLWLYSTNYGNLWWCYNSQLNEYIEALYQQSVKKKDNDEDGIKLNFAKIKTKTKTKPHNPISFTKFNFDNIMDDTNDEMVNFEDEDEEEESYKSEEKIVVLSPVISIGNTSYNIDLEAMKQINIHDSNKKRNIKRIEVPFAQDSSSIYIYMEKNDIIGVSGKKFD